MRKPPFHESDICAGHNCPYHNPSNHGMKDWPMSQRMDSWAFGLVERHCTHGVGHPDPDSVEWLESIVSQGSAGTWGIHGCDGCCSEDKDLKRRLRAEKTTERGDEYLDKPKTQEEKDVELLLSGMFQ